MPIWSLLSFQNRNSPIIEHLEFFHDHTIIILISTITVTGYLIMIFIVNPKINKSSAENQELELFWTSIPAVLLIFIAIPSLKILYIRDEINSPNITLKVLGNQWYWSYEIPELKILSFERFINKERLNNRNLTLRNRILMPTQSPLRVLISSSDVLHSWTIPSLGVKADATPGRLNQRFFSISRPRTLRGQCSEICGTNHRFIPISISATNTKNVIKN